MKKALLFITILLTIIPLFSNTNPKIIIQTEFGNITAEIYLKSAPITAENFLSHVKNGFFKNSRFYRTVTKKNQPNNKVKIEVIQAGPNDKLVIKKYGKNYYKKIGIKHETTKITGIRHLDGTISMARDKPGSASFSYFICINDQPSLDFGGKRNPDGEGFAAFGKVLKGMDIVKKIQKSTANGQRLIPEIKVKNIFIISKET